jgi:hypothetical protein
MSKFHLSKDLSELISNAVHAFALRLETEHHIPKEQVITIWEKCSDDVVDKKKPKKEEKEKTKTDAEKIQKMVKAELPERRFALRKNAYGEYEHKDTGFVFDPLTKEVKGKQVGDHIKDLSLSDVELCKHYGFKFRIPDRFEDDVLEMDAEVSDLEESDVDSDAE